jgi:hypothetical protein
MAERLSYTSGGSVYWPANYTVSTNFTNYLQIIYNELTSGNPVIFGAKKNNGGMHFAVVTGFSGGALNAANFKINDPGSSQRVNLQMLLNDYPNFYKILYYSRSA